MNPLDPGQLIDALEDVMVTTLALARELPEDSADLPTDCPGWTVRDQLAHIVGLEQTFAGSPPVPFELPPLDHVTDEFTRYIEHSVHARRLLPLQALADELAGLTPRRMAQLRGQLAAGGDPEIDGPFGPRPMSAVLSIRVFDMWAHEQDIRRAVDRPVRIDCDAARVAAARTLLAWQHGLPKIEGVDGVLTVTLTAPDADERRITIGDGGPEAALSGDAGGLTWLGCGRGTLGAAGGAIATSGSEELLGTIAPHLGFTP